MGRRSKSAIDLLLEAAARLSWPAGIGIAAVVFLSLRWLSLQPSTSLELGEGLGIALAWNVSIQVAALLQWVLPAIILVGIFAGNHRRGRQSQILSEMRQSGANRLGTLNWRQFEELLAGYFRDRGFTVVSNPDHGPDGGIDLKLKRGSELHLVQCKHWRARKVPVATVRELFGVMASQGAVGGFVVTSGKFTADAEKFAEGRNIELVNGEKLQTLLKSISGDWEARPVDQKARTSTPPCPSCGSLMIRRIARRGTNAGSTFWGCSRFPDCRGTRAIGD